MSHNKRSTPFGMLNGRRAVIPTGRPMASSVARAAGALALSAVVVMTWSTASAQSISELGSLLPNSNCQATAISADGTVVAGYSNVSTGHHAFRWTAAGGMQDLGDFGYNSTAFAVSADGTCVVGWALVQITRPDGSQGGYARVIRWTAADGLQNIGGSTVVDPSNGIANSGIGRAVNANGSVIVGDGGGICGLTESFRWTQATGTQSLGTFLGGDMCYSHVTVMGLSLDGSVAVGQSNGRAYRWTLGTGMADLGNLTNHPARIAFAKSISHDGTAIVGSWGVNAAGHIAQAFRWREGVGMENLGSLDGAGIEPADGANISVSADGSVVVGTSYTSGGIVRPFLWTQDIGMVNLQTYLPAIGVDLTGWSLCYATGISADGRTIVGNACASPGATSGFIITLPAVLPACLSLSALDNAFACADGSATFSVTATGAGPMTFQWRKGGAPIDSTANPSAATTTLTMTGIQAADADRYDCVVSTACGSATSNQATLTVSSADFDRDGDTGTDADIEAFFACLGGNCCPTCGSVDFDGDGDTGTDLDIESFFRVLGGGPC